MLVSRKSKGPREVAALTVLAEEVLGGGEPILSRKSAFIIIYFVPR
jgi:hypothetical protein